jgi:hypothetical protein
MDMPKIEPRTAHERLCAVIRKHARERKQGSREEIARLLKQAEGLDQWTSRLLGEFLDPGVGTLKTGPKAGTAREKFERHVEVAWTLGLLQRMIGEDGGPVSMVDAREMACQVLECSATTLKEIVNSKRPMGRVVEWGRNGVEPSKEDLKQLWDDFTKEGQVFKK